MLLILLCRMIRATCSFISRMQYERILYELCECAEKTVAAQQSLFPSTIELAAADAVLLQELLPDLQLLGYQLEPLATTLL